MTASLVALEVLALDCQATAAFPRGELLEVGWARASAGERGEPEVESHLVAPSGPLRLSPRVRQLTGLTVRELRAAPPCERVRARLTAVLEQRVAAGAGRPCVGVVHFARFEEPFLRRLVSGGGDLPLELLCTHEIARRLLPTLPRRGLRAMAGYLGHAVPECRRARHHVRATVLIWRELVSRLTRDHGVRSLEALREWLASEEPVRGVRSYPLEPRIRLELPDGPGVYRFRRTDGSVLYVGKAMSLRQRVNTYFQTSRGHKERTLEMLTQARRVDFVPTGSALEAALLEPDEIKRLRPPYNVALREEDRRLAYGSWTMRHVVPAPDARHPIGPFLLRAPRPPLTALLQILDARGDARLAERLAASVLGVPRRYGPSLSCFRAGLALFTRRHGRGLGPRPGMPSLRSLARRLERRGDRPDESDEEPPAPPAGWTPEAVAGALERVVVRGMHVVRRSRWLCALSECSVAWEATEEAGGPRRCLVVSGGAAVSRHELVAGEELPVPPGHARPREERQRGLGLAAYDRVSVLSRELKRLVSAGGRVEVRLGPARGLDRRALEAALRWW